jgi:hypothetical protein
MNHDKSLVTSLGQPAISVDLPPYLVGFSEREVFYHMPLSSDYLPSTSTSMNRILTQQPE